MKSVSEEFFRMMAGIEKSFLFRKNSLTKSFWTVILIAANFFLYEVHAESFTVRNMQRLKTLKENDLLSVPLNEFWVFCPGDPEENWMKQRSKKGVKIHLKSGIINLDSVQDKPASEKAEAVLYQEFISEKDGIALLGTGCDWWCEVYVNGELCLSTMEKGNQNGNYAPDNHVFFIPVRKGKNLLAVRVRRGSYTWTFAFGKVPFKTMDLPEIETGPWLGDPDENTICIRFTTLGKIGSAVEFRRKGGKESRTVWNHRLGQILRRKFHAVRLENLESGTEYEYRVVLIDPENPQKTVPASKWFSFQLPKREDAEYSFFLTADLQLLPEQQRKTLKELLNAANGKSCDFFVLNGDIGNSFDSDQLIADPVGVLSKYGAAEKPIIMVRGNHEFNGEKADEFLDYFASREGLSYGLFRFGDTAFLLLDSWNGHRSKNKKRYEYSLPDTFYDLQKKYILKALKSERWINAKRRIVFAHSATYSHPDSEMCRFMRDLTDSELGGSKPRTRLNLWFAAHTHLYTRSIPGTNKIAAQIQPLERIVSGTNYTYPVLTVAGPIAEKTFQASAFRVDAKTDRLVVSAFTQDGVCFEKVEYFNDGKIVELQSLPKFEIPGSVMPGKSHGVRQ
jgi:calcineurin-like phosphoesterase